MNEELKTTVQNEENKETSTVVDKIIEKKTPVRRTTTTRKTPVKKALIKPQVEPIVITNESKPSTVENDSQVEEATSSVIIDSKEVVNDSFQNEKLNIETKKNDKKIKTKNKKMSKEEEDKKKKKKALKKAKLKAKKKAKKKKAIQKAKNQKTKDKKKKARKKSKK